MTALIDNQVVSCLAEMERLKEKIKALNKEKQERAATKKKKIRDPEPNMAVLDKWLKKNEEAEIFDKKADEAEKNYRTFDHRYNHKTVKERREHNGKQCEISRNLDPYYENGINSKRKTIKQQLFMDPYVAGPGQFMKDFIEATHNLFQIQQKRIDELEIKLQAQHHTPRQLEYMAHKRASRFKAHLAEKIHTGSPDTYQGCGGSCAICLKDMTSGEMCYKLNTGGMEHVFHRVCGEQQM
jgi:hypothetical protein